MPKRTQEYLDSRREKVARAALQCFLRKGYHATSIEDICRRAKVSAGTIYKYFSSKREMLLAAQQAEVERRLAQPLGTSWAQIRDQYIAVARSLDEPKTKAAYRIALELNIDALFDDSQARESEQVTEAIDRQMAEQLQRLSDSGAINLPLGAEVTVQIINALAFNLVSYRNSRPSRSTALIAEQLAQTLDMLVGANNSQARSSRSKTRT